MSYRLSRLVWLSMALASILVLAAGLSGLEFGPGRPFSLGPGLWLGPQNYGVPPTQTRFMASFIRAMFVLALVLLPISIVYVIVSREARKQVLRNMIVVGIVIAVLAYLRNRLGGMAQAPALDLEPAPPAPELVSPFPLAQFDPTPPGWLVAAISFGLALLVVLIASGVLQWMWLRRRPAEGPLQQLGREAQAALDALQTGGDVRNAVMRCYAEMSRVVREERGIQRQQEVTTREFERQLEGAGLPAEHVRRLTRLFEDVRYGARATGDREEREAVACLAAIAHYCARAWGARSSR